MIIIVDAGRTRGRVRGHTGSRLPQPMSARPGRMTQMGSLMLLDTASLYFRAFYGVPETVAAPDGTPVNAIRGLLDMITRLVRARHPDRLVACLDADWRPAFRSEEHTSELQSPV